MRLMARRLKTGERFCALTIPRCWGPHIDPSEIPESDLQQAVSLETLRLQWRDFLRPEDVWLTWTDFPLALMAQSGLETRAADDLKHWCAGMIEHNPGTIAHASALLGLPEQAAEPKMSRTERSLETLEAIFRQLLAMTEVQRTTS